MKKRTKWLAAAACVALFVVMAVGSGSSDSDKKDVVAVGTDSSAVAESTSAEDTENESAAAETTVEESKAADVTIEEQVLVDQDGIKVTAIEYVTDSIWGDSVKVLVENTSDTDYTVGCDALIVNDYMIYDLFACEIAAGKKANEEIYLSSTELEAAGIDSVGKIEIYFHAYDDNWEDLFDGVYAEIQTSEYANMDTTPNDAGMELYNDNGIRIVGKTVDENSFWGTAILLYCENNTGRNVVINTSDLSINGFMIDPYFSATVYDGKKTLDEITLFSEDLESNGIEAIEEVELKFSVYDEDTYEDILETDPITFTAQ